MAWYKCGGGGALTETVLWTNPSPTSTFSGTECSLSSTLDYAIPTKISGLK